MQFSSESVYLPKSSKNRRNYFSTWSISILIFILLSSCKTQFVPSVKQEQFYAIDSNITADSSILAYYRPFKLQLEAEMNRVIGYSDQHLSKPFVPETLVGNFFVDALLWKGKQLDPTTQVSFATKGGIRSDLRAGDVTIGNIYEMMPFENKICILTLRGEDMLRWASFIAKAKGQPAAGIRLEIDKNQISSFKINGETVNPSAQYKLITYDYLANGGDYIDFFDNVIQRQDYDQAVRDVLIEYVEHLSQKGENIQVELDGRIQITE